MARQAAQPKCILLPACLSLCAARVFVPMSASASALLAGDLVSSGTGDQPAHTPRSASPTQDAGHLAGVARPLDLSQIDCQVASSASSHSFGLSALASAAASAAAAPAHTLAAAALAAQSDAARLRDEVARLRGEEALWRAERERLEEEGERLRAACDASYSQLRAIGAEPVAPRRYTVSPDVYVVGTPGLPQRDFFGRCALRRLP